MLQWMCLNSKWKGPLQKPRDESFKLTLSTVDAIELKLTDQYRIVGQLGSILKSGLDR